MSPNNTSWTSTGYLLFHIKTYCPIDTTSVSPPSSPPILLSPNPMFAPVILTNKYQAEDTSDHPCSFLAPFTFHIPYEYPMPDSISDPRYPPNDGPWRWLSSLPTNSWSEIPIPDQTNVRSESTNSDFSHSAFPSKIPLDKSPSYTPSVTSVTSSSEYSIYSLPYSGSPSPAPSTVPPDQKNLNPLSPPMFHILGIPTTTATYFKHPTVFSTVQPSLAPKNVSSVPPFHKINLLHLYLPRGASVLPPRYLPPGVPSPTPSLKSSLLKVLPVDYPLCTPSCDAGMNPSLVTTVWPRQ